MIQRPATSTLFPYTTLFRSRVRTVRTLFLRKLEHVQHVSAGGRIDLRRDSAWHHARTAAAVARSHRQDRKSTRLNSSHSQISYAVFCLKKKNTHSPPKTHSG